MAFVFLFVCLAALVISVVCGLPAKPFPDFVLKYAPSSYLHSDEQYWPTDLQVFLTGVIPEVDFKPVAGPQTLQTLSTLASNVYLTAVNSDVLAHDSEFFRSTVGKPTDTVSNAPAIIIVVEKPGGIVDAFYFYFYAFNYGGM